MKFSNDANDQIDYSDPFAIYRMLDEVDSGKYGSVTRDLEAVTLQRMQHLTPLINASLNTETFPRKEVSKLAGEPAGNSGQENIITLDDDGARNDAPTAAQPVLILDDSDEEDNTNWKPSYPFQQIFLATQAGVAGQSPVGDIAVKKLQKRCSRRWASEC